MDVPSLRIEDRNAWQYFRRLSDDDLYALLSGSQAYGDEQRQPDSLGIRLFFSTSRTAIEAGRARLEKVLRQIRQAVCDRWAEVRREFGSEIMTADIMVSVVHAIVILTPGVEHDSLSHIVISELILRTCNYSLDRLCG